MPSKSHPTAPGHGLPSPVAEHAQPLSWTMPEAGGGTHWPPGSQTKPGAQPSTLAQVVVQVPAGFSHTKGEQSLGSPATQAPAWQVSWRVQPSPLAQGVPSGLLA
jgi:hypothetical protein